MKIIYVNCGVKNYMKVDHRSYRMQLLQLQKESLKKIQACMGFESLTSAILVQCSYHHWANKPTGSVSLNWFIINPWKDDDESYEYNENHYVNCGVKNYMKVDHRSYRRNFCSFFFFRLSFRNCSVVILNPADTIFFFYTWDICCSISHNRYTCTCMHVFPRDKPFFLCHEHNCGKIKINKSFKYTT